MHPLRKTLAALAILSAPPAGAQGLPDDGSVLPFPPKPSSSIAAPTLQESNSCLSQRKVTCLRMLPTS